MTIKELAAKQIKEGGYWLVRFKDNNKYVVSSIYGDMAFDSYVWYKIYGTLESELPMDVEDFLKDAVEVKLLEESRKLNEWKVVMLGENDENITMNENLTLEDANRCLYECKKNDWVHYYEIRRMNNERN